MQIELRSHDDTTADSDTPALASLRLVAGDTDLHPEDAFLRQFGVFLRRALRLTRAERALADALARDALDRVDGPEGDFARLPARAWLAAKDLARAHHAVSHEMADRLALALVAFLCASGRLQPAAARRLRRDLGSRDRSAAHAA